MRNNLVKDKRRPCVECGEAGFHMLDCPLDNSQLSVPTQRTHTLDEFISWVEADHFRSEYDTGANSNALFIWNLIRRFAELPRLRENDLRTKRRSPITQPADDSKITTVPDALAPGTEVPEATSDVVPLNLRIENGGAWIPEVLQQVLIPANCGVSGHFQFQENGGHCMMCQRWDAAVGKLVEALRAAIADYYNLNATQFYLKYRTNDPLVAFDAAYEAASTGGKR